MNEKATLVTRQAALEILRQVDLKKYSSELLRKASRDRSLHYPLLQRLVKGTLQWKERLDSELGAAVGTRYFSLSETERWLFRMAAYQMLFLKRVHREVVFRETSRLLRPKARSLIGRLSNLRRGAELKSREPAQIAAHYSHPLWLIEKWVQRLGAEEVLALCEANNRPWPVCLRTNTAKCSRAELLRTLRDEGVRAKPGALAPDAILVSALPRGVKLDRLASFRHGLFQVQDESAQLVALLLDPKPGDVVLDLCAAPGGKATHLAALMENEGRIVACDLSSGRLRMVEENCRRQGVSIVRPLAGDARKLKLPAADRILIDAPCSGVGVLGRKGDIRWMRDERSIPELTRLQTELLEAAAVHLRERGRLVYSTCTLLLEENQMVVEDFLSRHSDFRLVPGGGRLPAPAVTREGYLEVWPHRHGTSGAFAACIERGRH